MVIDGQCDPRFTDVANAFRASFESDPEAMETELGASVCVYYRGEPVVDLWGGFTDSSRATPWANDTIVNVQSVSKGFLATCALLLIDRGLLDVEKPMSHYWPEFAAKGKRDLPVKWALSHQLGMPAWEYPEPGMGYDWQRATAGLADSKPDLVPGRDKAYHAYTFGFLVGEVIQRIVDTPINKFLSDEITGRLNIDFYYGVRPEDNHRVATFTKLRHGDNVAGLGSGVAPRFADIARRTIDVLNHDEDYNSQLWRRAVIPAANGHTNARAMARLYAALAQGGELDGVKIASAEAIERVTQLQWGGDDLMIPANTNVALGYMLNSPSYFAGPNPRTFGHAGFGGAYGFADRENVISFGYTPNRLWLGTKVETGRRTDRLVDALYRSVAKL